eukprot:9475290-Pyramimonas_sp.AAC.1
MSRMGRMMMVMKRRIRMRRRMAMRKMRRRMRRGSLADGEVVAPLALFVDAAAYGGRASAGRLRSQV